MDPIELKHKNNECNQKVAINYQEKNFKSVHNVKTSNSYALQINFFEINVFIRGKK